MLPGLARLLPLLLLPCAMTLQAYEMYRYVDRNGITVISRLGVPADVIGNGYEVLNDQGRVIRVVPRALTAEEHRQLAEEKRQAEVDRQLMRLYSQVADVDRAAARKQAELDATISLVRRNMGELQRERSTLLNEAANLERADKPVPQMLQEQIAEMDEQEQKYLQEIAGYQGLKGEFDKSFARDRARVVELLQEKNGLKN